MRKGIMAMEQLANFTNPEELVTVAVTDENSVENTHAKLTNLVAEAETNTSNISAAVEASATLSEMANAVEDTLPDGGISEAHARALDVAIEQMSLSLGYNSNKKKTFPALEGFTKIKTRQASTELAMEGIRNFVSKIWEAIKAAIQKAIAWVMQFIHNLRLNNSALTARCAKLLVKAKSMTGGAYAPKTGETINSTILKKFLRVAHGSTEPGDFSSTLGKHAELMSKYLRKTDDLIETTFKTIKDTAPLIEQIHIGMNMKIMGTTVDPSNDKATEKITEKFNNLTTGGTSNVTDKALALKYGPEMVLNGVPFVFGNDVLVFSLLGKHVKTLTPENIGKIGMFVQKNPLDYDAKESGVLPLSPEQCVASLVIVEKHLTETVRDNAAIDKLVKELQQIEKTTLSKLFAASNEFYQDRSDSAKTTAYSMVYALIRAAIQIVTSGRSALVLSDYSALKHALAYSASSLALCERSGETIEAGSSHNHLRLK